MIIFFKESKIRALLSDGIKWEFYNLWCSAKHSQDLGQILGSWGVYSRTAVEVKRSVAPKNRLDPEVTIYASLLFQSVGVLHELSVSHFDI